MVSGDHRDELARVLHDTLRRAEDEREEPAYETLEAYVDGRLGDVDREILESRVADDPALRAEVDDLRALRAAMAAPTAAPVHVALLAVPDVAPAAAPRVAFLRRWAMPAGLAAAAVIALLVWRDTRPSPVIPPPAQRPPVPAPVAAPPRPPASDAPAVVEAIRDHGRSIGMTPEGTVAGLEGFPPRSRRRSPTPSGMPGCLPRRWPARSTRAPVG